MEYPTCKKFGVLAKCGGVCKVYVTCEKCKGNYHRYCERIKTEDNTDNYVCKDCRKAAGESEVRVSLPEQENKDNDTSLSLSDVEESSTYVQEILLTNKNLREENVSLKEIISQLSSDLAEVNQRFRNVSSENESLKSELDNHETYTKVVKSGREVQKNKAVLDNGIGLENSFKPLSDMDTSRGNDKSVDRSEDNKEDKPDVTVKKRKIMLVGDSHAKRCQKALQSCLGDKYEVLANCKPGAPIKDVVKDLNQDTESYDEMDHVIVLAGTNDIELGNDVNQSIETILPITKRTNLQICPVMKRFDKPYLNNKIRRVNRSMHEFINNFENKKGVNLTVNFGLYGLGREHFTSHGLHLNNKGKSNLCSKIAGKILMSEQYKNLIAMKSFLGK